nr:hypothetical protein CFP56_22251 [Quercus suber]
MVHLLTIYEQPLCLRGETCENDPVYFDTQACAMNAGEERQKVCRRVSDNLKPNEARKSTSRYHLCSPYCLRFSFETRRGSLEPHHLRYYLIFPQASIDFPSCDPLYGVCARFACEHPSSLIDRLAETCCRLSSRQIDE